MDALNSLPVLLQLTILVVAVIATIVVLRLRRARARARRRVVEKPNSHYTSQLALNGEARHRWSGIALDGMHEVNRAEVVRLLAYIQATGVDALRPNERAFLDRMAELADRSPPAEPTATSRQSPPDLRHRPA